MKINSYIIAPALIALVFNYHENSHGNRSIHRDWTGFPELPKSVQQTAPNDNPSGKGLNTRRSRFPKRYVIPPRIEILQMGLMPLPQAHVKWV